MLCGMWDLPRPGLEPVFPALAGGFLTTEPPGKPREILLITTLSLTELFNKSANRIITLEVRFFFLYDAQAKKKRGITE